MPDFSDKVVIITGASTGIGRAAAFAFHQAGAQVVLAARSAGLLAEFAQTLGGPERAIAIPTDVSDSDQCERLIAETVAHFDHIDVLVNNAGMIVSGKFEYLQTGDMEQQFAVNFFGAVSCTRAAVPYLKASRGVIINISSVAGLIGAPTTSAYSASKAAMNAWSRALWAELRPEGVGVVTVCPYFTSGVQLAQKGVLRAGSLHSSEKQHRRAPGTQTAEQVARAILKAARRRPRIVVLSPAGKLIWLLDRLFPWLTDWVMARGLPWLTKDGDGS